MITPSIFLDILKLHVRTDIKYFLADLGYIPNKEVKRALVEKAALDAGYISLDEALATIGYVPGIPPLSYRESQKQIKEIEKIKAKEIEKIKAKESEDLIWGIA